MEISKWQNSSTKTNMGSVFKTLHPRQTVHPTNSTLGGPICHKSTTDLPTVICGNLTPNKAFDAMVAGKIVQRFRANIPGKFHSMRPELISNAGELQVHTANTAQDVVDGNWHATQTDVATWFSSTFNVVTIKASAIQIIYEG